VPRVTATADTVARAPRESERGPVIDRLRAVSPRLAVAYSETMHRFRWRRAPVARITRAFVRHHGLTVQDGPFAGMRFPDYAVGKGEFLVPQLLGAYEHELRPAIADVVEGGYQTIVDIGASDGYYAVGLARALPGSTVHAFEQNPFPARVCRALARENGVDERVLLHGKCTVEELRGLPAGRAFVLSDCEGAEAELMDPEAVPMLRQSMLIVELHEFAAPRIEDTMRRRFETSHEIEVLDTRCRWTADWPKLHEVPGVGHMDRELGLSEFRPQPMKWAVMRPKSA
jgi:hypothetical protein